MNNRYIDEHEEKQIMETERKKFQVINCLIGVFLLSLFGYFLYRWSGFFVTSSAWTPKNNKGLFGEEVLATSGSLDNIHFEWNKVDLTCRTGQNTWTASKTLAQKKGGRLCTTEEIDRLLKDQPLGYISSDLSYAAAENKGKAKWVDVSSINQEDSGEVIDGSKVPWTEDTKSYSANDNTYPYWVGTTVAWCT